MSKRNKIIIVLVSMLAIYCAYITSNDINGVSAKDSPIEYTAGMEMEYQPAVAEVQIETLKDMVLKTSQEFAAAHIWIANEYDCTQFSIYLKELLLRQYRNITVRMKEWTVNCSYSYWSNCKEFNGLHDFLYVNLNDWAKPFYVEATTGYEITSGMYAFYNMNPERGEMP